MPKVGDIKRVKRTHYYIRVKCPNCGVERWTQRYRKDRATGLCLSCYNKSRHAQESREKARKSVPSNNPKQAGISYHKGYRVISVTTDDFFYPMVQSTGRVLEHRLIMAKHLGRCLHSWEIVHHRNGLRDDNRIENLQLISNDGHIQVTILEQKVKKLERKLEALERGEWPG